MTKLKCKKCYGDWYYEIEMPTLYNDLDAPIYHLYKDKNGKEFVANFSNRDDILFYIINGTFY